MVEEGLKRGESERRRVAVGIGTSPPLNPARRASREEDKAPDWSEEGATSEWLTEG